MWSSRRSLSAGMDGSLEPRLPCPEAVAGDKASASPRLSPIRSLLLPPLMSRALVEREAKSSELLRDPTGSLYAWFATLVMFLASLLEMSSSLLPGDSTLTPRMRGGWVDKVVEGWGDVLPCFAEDCAWRLGCKQESVDSKGWDNSLAEGDSEVEAGNGEGGLIWKDALSCVPLALLVRVSFVPRVQGLTGEGECGSWCWASTSRVWQPSSGWVDTSRLRGSDKSPNGDPGWVGATSPTVSSNTPSPNDSPTGSTGSNVASGGPLVHNGGSWGYTQSLINLVLPMSNRDTLGGGRILAKGGHVSHGSSSWSI